MRKKLIYTTVVILIALAWYLFDNKKSIYRAVNKKSTIDDTFEGDSINIPMPENILRNAIKELESDEFQKGLLEDIGFSDEGSKKILSEDPKNPLSLKDVPKEIQNLIKKDLENRKTKGYSETTNKNADEITGVINYIISTSKSIPNIRFSLSNIPNIINTNYDYIGYTFPGVFESENLEGSYGSVRRIYGSVSSNHLLIIEESANNKNAGAYLIKDFVNATVNKYPAIYSIKKSPNGKYFALLNWIIPSYTYNLYFVGILNNNTKNILLSVGSEMSKINIKDEDNSKSDIDSDNPLLQNKGVSGIFGT